VEQDPWTERYRLGRGSVLLGQVATRQLGLPGVLDELRRLVDATGESASLGFREGSEVVVLLRVESPHPLRFDRPPGSRERLHASAMGKVLLAWAGDPAGEIAVMPPLPSFTARTITKRAALTAEVAQIKARGWALNDEERHLGVRAVAAPVFQTGLVRASVAVQGPSNRLTDDRLDDLAATVRDAALAIAPQLNL
jgi:IclR family acetate operon transcriptional repressor